MLYFKHSELVDKYHVSLKTVHNWIDASKKGKLDLELVESKGRTYISNKAVNLQQLEDLVEQGKKYRNVRFHTTAAPTREFYDIYNRKQILDIITNLKVNREIPRQYNYFNGGAANWDVYAERMWEDDAPNLTKSSASLLKANYGTIDMLLSDYDRVNVIDIGPGNALPIKGLLEHLSQSGKLNRYIGIDISKEMLDIAQKNIRDWFGDAFRVETHLKDITYERFDDLLVDDMLDSTAEKTINIALFLGATPMNFKAPEDALKVIRSSMAQDDILIYTDKPDSEAERRYFDFNSVPGVSTLSPNHRYIFDLLNIDESLYDVEMDYNTKQQVRYIQVRLKKALTIKFTFENGERLVHLNKGETILLWRAWHMTVLEIIAGFEKVGFMLLQTSLTKDRQYLLTISGIESKPGVESQK